MANAGKKLPNGEAVREFYASLDMINNYYWDKGYRKKAYLYRTLKEKLGWRMSLASFKYHLKKELVFDSQNLGGSKRSSQVEAPKKELDTPSPDEIKDPPIAKASFKVGKKFNPHTVEIDPSRIVNKKK